MCLSRPFSNRMVHPLRRESARPETLCNFWWRYRNVLRHCVSEIDPIVHLVWVELWLWVICLELIKNRILSLVWAFINVCAEPNNNRILRLIWILINFRAKLIESRILKLVWASIDVWAKLSGITAATCHIWSITGLSVNPWPMLFPTLPRVRF